MAERIRRGAGGGNHEGYRRERAVAAVVNDVTDKPVNWKAEWLQI